VREMCRSPSCSIFVGPDKARHRDTGVLDGQPSGEYTSASGRQHGNTSAEERVQEEPPTSSGDGGGTRNVVGDRYRPEGGVGEGPRRSDLQHTSMKTADAAQYATQQGRMTKRYVHARQSSARSTRDVKRMAASRTR